MIPSEIVDEHPTSLSVHDMWFRGAVPVAASHRHLPRTTLLSPAPNRNDHYCRHHHHHHHRHHRHHHLARSHFPRQHPHPRQCLRVELFLRGGHDDHLYGYARARIPVRMQSPIPKAHYQLTGHRTMMTEAHQSRMLSERKSRRRWLAALREQRGWLDPVASRLVAKYA